MANTPEKPQMTEEERANLKAMIAAGRELSPEMDESLVESYAQQRAAEEQARAKAQGKAVVVPQQQSNNPLAGVHPAVAIAGIGALAAVFIVIMLVSGGAYWWMIFPLFGIFGGWWGNHDRYRARNERRAQRYQTRADYYRRRMGYPDEDDSRLPESSDSDEAQLPPPPASAPTPPAPRSAPSASSAPPTSPSGVSDTQPPINPAG